MVANGPQISVVVAVKAHFSVFFISTMPGSFLLHAPLTVGARRVQGPLPGSPLVTVAEEKPALWTASRGHTGKPMSVISIMAYAALQRWGYFSSFSHHNRYLKYFKSH